MKKKTFACAALAFALLSSASAVSRDSVILEIPVRSNARSISDLSYATDDEGNVSAPADIEIYENKICLLNSAQNCILKFEGGVLKDTIALNDVHAVNIAYDGEDIYLISSALGLYRYSDAAGLTYLASLADTFDETITGFQVSNGYGYLATPDGVHGTTYQFSLSSIQSGSASMTAIAGLRLDDDTFYYYDESDPDQAFSQQAALTIYSKSTGRQDVVTVSSDYYIGAIQYLGRDAENNYVIRLEEVTQDADYKIKTAESLRIYAADTDRTLLSILDIPKQEKYITEQFSCYGGHVYQLNNLASAVQLIKLSADSGVAPDVYVSPLAVYHAPAADAASENTDKMRAAGIASMKSYKVPRFIDEAGDYECMPRCGMHVTG